MENQEPPDFYRVIGRGCYFTPKGCMIIDGLRHNTFYGFKMLTEREPTNPYDSNAIKVFCDMDELGCDMIGYIGREYATEIAPWMDRGVFYITTLIDVMGCCPIYNLIALRGSKAEDKVSKLVDVDLSEIEKRIIIEEV